MHIQSTMPIQTTTDLTKILLETALEVNGSIRSCPIEYLRDKNKWIFWDETWSKPSGEYHIFDAVLGGFYDYCKNYIEQGNTA